MKVSFQHNVPLDEFARQYGVAGGATFSEAHAALLRAQGIKPVSVETTYGQDAGAQSIAIVPQTLPAASLPAAGEVDLAPLYGIFIQLADALTETRERIEGQILDQERVNQNFASQIDSLEGRVAAIEDALGFLAEAAKKNASAA